MNKSTPIYVRPLLITALALVAALTACRPSSPTQEKTATGPATSTSAATKTVTFFLPEMGERLNLL